MQPVDSADRLSFTLFVALAVHALLILGISFSADQSDKVAPTLNITLATHKAQQAPDKADYLAQLNQEASGTLEQAEQLTTEQQAQISDTQIRDINPEPQLQATTPVQRQTQVVSTSADTARQTTEAPDPELQEEVQQLEGDQQEQLEVSAEIASLRAKLDQQRQQYAKKPRVRRITSVATKASYDAEYLHKWSNKVEFVGNRNYPQEALQNNLFGDLRLAAVILPNGTIEKVEILQSSGHAVLDDAAMQIVHLASPFAPFPPEIRREADQLEIIRTWHFEITGFSTTN
ncbi:energy transducer TonB [Exilibacterium tricleocarpae]|uniref:Energy transducer TonB n=1 Tax=Exilibacterium tricleocarpae TaxID=2591008 RepID=A0A545SXM7_9GAMM|nr:energy transducer TonB [Exilibacterium tricleocarpae]